MTSAEACTHENGSANVFGWGCPDCHLSASFPHEPGCARDTVGPPGACGCGQFPGPRGARGPGPGPTGHRGTYGEPGVTVLLAPPGDDAAAHAGDLVLTHDPSSLVCRLIRAAQRLRFRGDRAGFAYWNHVACVVGDGELIEARGRFRVRRASLAEYEPRWYAVCHLHASEADGRQMVAYAEHALGEPYGYLAIVSLLGWVLTGGRLSVALDGTEFCSQLAANFAARGGYIFRRGAVQTMPADIAEKFGVRGPS